MKKIILIPLVLFGFLSVNAQTYVPSVEVNPDARSAGMAGSTIADEANAFSIFGNMPAISFSESKFAASYAFNVDFNSKTPLHSVAGYYKLNQKHSFAIGVRYLGMEEFEASDDGVAYETIKPYDAIADLGYAYAINDVLSVGANLRYVNSKLGMTAASAFGFDAGVYYNRNAWSAALTVNNLGTKLDYGDGGDFMPAGVNAGGSYRFMFADKHRLTGNLQVGYRFLPSTVSYFGGGVGLEYSYNDMFAVRGGYRMGDDESRTILGNYASVGCGVYVGPVVVDFAWLLPMNGSKEEAPTGNVWRVSAGVRF